MHIARVFDKFHTPDFCKLRRGAAFFLPTFLSASPLDEGFAGLNYNVCE